MNSRRKPKIIVNIDLENIALVSVNGRKGRFVIADEERSPVCAI